MLIIILICVAFSLFTIANYIFSGLYSRNHRLLPMVMMVITLYYFYVLVEQITGASQAFILLKDLLIIHVFSILFYYIIELMEIKIKPVIYVAVSVLDIFMVLVICLQVQERVAYRKFVLFFLLFICLHLVIFVIASIVKKSFTRNQKSTYMCLFIGFLVPLFALIVSITEIVPDKYIMVPAFMITEILFNYLLISDKMIDARTLIKEELFSSVGAASLLFDADLYFLDASKSARENFPELIAELENSPQTYDRQDELREWTRHYTDSNEFEIDGRYYNCMLQKVFLKNKPWGYILLLNDVTVQKNEANKAMEDSNNKSIYLAKMSHELRSPLHAIIGGSEIILSKREASERTLFMINQIRHAGEKLLSIVNSILEYSKMENGELLLANRPYEFLELISDQACSTLVNLRGKNVDFSLETHNSVPRKLSGDEMRIREIIRNLLSNAVKFTESGSIKCDVYLEEKEGRAYVTIKVTDSGVGMTKEQMACIFNEYVSYANEKSIEGTGLGLSICKELCLLMGGDVTAESDGVSGTVMTASFFQDYCEAFVDGKRDSSKDKGPFVIDKTMGPVSTIIDFSKVTPTYKYPKAKVLVVDDLDVNQHIFFEMTRPWAFMIDKAYSGREAIALFEENEYDLIVLDQMMPGMSGLETLDVIRKINERGKEIPVVMITADISDSMKDLCAEHGFTSYLEKPIVMQQLKDVLEKNLPVRYRRPCLITDMTFLNNGNRVSLTVRESYLKECEDIRNILPVLARTDIDMFRIKVHGLKSTSRQLGYDTMAEFSEVMEMAAKSGHSDFINRHIDKYLDDISVIVEKVEQEMV